MCHLEAQRDSLSPFVVTKGIYTSYTSLRNSVPNRNDSFHLIKRSGGDIFMWGGSEYGFVLDSSGKDEWRSLRKMVVGLSDGKQFYISDKYTTGGWFGLTPCYLNGPLILTLNKGNLAQYTGGGIIPALIPTGNGFVINIQTREHFPLTESFLKKLLKKYPGLEYDFSKKMNLMDHVVEILESVNEKMTEAMKPSSVIAK